MTTQASKSGMKPPTAGYLVALGFWILALAVFFGSSGDATPVLTQAVSVEPERLAPGAYRTAMSDPPTLTNGAVTQRCSDCHTLFESEREPGRALVQHTDIRLRHGSNNACLNCHDRKDREKLTLRNADPVGFADVARLCAQCHGPVYRDWIKGAHGKTIGAWDPASPASVRLTCSQCHDPHSPAYAPIEPLPGPNTLRMGNQRASHHAVRINENSPLQRWRMRANDAPTGGDH